MDVDSQDLLKQAIALARNGDKVKARDLLLQVVEVNPHNELAWIWLSGLVDTLEDRIVACENVLTINPANEKVRAYLSDLIRQQNALAIEQSKRRIDEMFQRAQSFAKQGDTENALDLIHHILEQDDRHESAWYLLASLSKSANEKVQALEKVVEINPANTHARSELAEAVRFRSDPLEYATQLEEEGKISEAIEQYKQLAAKTKNPKEFDRIYEQIVRLENLQEEKIAHVNPSSTILRLTFTWPLLYFILILVQMGLNPIAHPAFILCMGLPVVGLGSFLLALAEVRARHSAWKKLFQEENERGSSFTRFVAAFAGWALIIIPHILLLLDSFNRLRNFKIPPEPF